MIKIEITIEEKQNNKVTVRAYWQSNDYTQDEALMAQHITTIVTQLTVKIKSLLYGRVKIAAKEISRRRKLTTIIGNTHD